MDGSGVSNAVGHVMLCGCVVHVDVHGEVIVAGCYLIATEHSRRGLSCMQKLGSA